MRRESRKGSYAICHQICIFFVGIDQFIYIYILSVSKIMYPLGSLGNKKERQQAPEPSSSDYIIMMC